MSIGILLIDISILKSLHVFCQMYLEDTFREKPDMFLRGIPDCNDDGSKSSSYKTD